MKTLTIALLAFMCGALSVKTMEDVVMPRIENGWNMVDDAKHQHCLDRSRKILRRVTFTSRGFYLRCMNEEI